MRDGRRLEEKREERNGWKTKSGVNDEGRKGERSGREEQTEEMAMPKRGGGLQGHTTVQFLPQCYDSVVCLNDLNMRAT